MSYRTADAGAAAGWMAFGVLALAAAMVIRFLARRFQIVRRR